MMTPDHTRAHRLTNGNRMNANMKPFLLLAALLSCACMSFAAEGGNDDPRVGWGVAQANAALEQAGLNASQLEVAVAPASTGAAAGKPEGYRLTVADGRARVEGFDAAGALYGCLELGRRVRELGRLPEGLDTTDGPRLSLRGTCILLMKLGTYDYPVTPEEFPFFYDKALWTEYLDFLTANGFNYIAFWNGHPFDYFVKLDKYPEAQAGMDPALIERNHDMLLWLGTEAAKRNIWLMFQFYNIHTSVYFQKAHNLPAWNPKPTPLLTEYTGHCIERFVSEFPGIGLYICPGEALQLEYTSDWINDVIFEAVKRTGKTPPIMVRAWGIDLEHMKRLVGHYPRLYTEHKFNVEMIAGTEIDPAAKDWAAVTGNHVVNIHCLGNLEPFRWNPPSYIQQCMQSAAGAGATGLHLYPRKAWRWPYGCDKTITPELQWRRDRLWFEAWGRYAWNPDRDPGAERQYWTGVLAAMYGEAAAAPLLESFEAGADVLPAIQRLLWIGNDNHTVAAAGATMAQLAAAPGIPFLPTPGVARMPEYIAAKKAGKTVGESSPTEFFAKKAAEAEKASEAAHKGAEAATLNRDEAGRIASDAEAVEAVARFYRDKSRAAVAKALADEGVDVPANTKTCLDSLRASVGDFRHLTKLTNGTYESLSDVPAWNPSKELPCPYGWKDLLPLYNSELAETEAAFARPASGDGTERIRDAVMKWEKDSPLRAQMYKHVLALTQEDQAQLPVADSAGAWAARRQELRGKLRPSLGLDPLPERTPLNARTTGTIDEPNYVLEKIVYEAWPGIPVPAHLYLPRNAARPLPCVLYVLGHWYGGKSEKDPRTFCAGMARHGVAVLTFDPMGQGERFAPEEHGHRFPILAGLSQEGFMVWESMRAVDYLAARPEIDAARVGITGASGGGLNTVFTAAVDDRFAAVAPVCYPTTWDSFMDVMTGQNWNGGVDLCNQAPNCIRDASMADLMACAAPKPQMEISAVRDKDFQIGGARETAARVKSIYAFTAPDKFSFVEIDDVHGYSKPMREAAYGFFLKALAGSGDGTPAPETPMDAGAVDEAALRCFPEGKQTTGPLLETLVKGMLPSQPEFSTPPDAAGMDEWKAALAARIRAVCAVPQDGEIAPVEVDSARAGNVTVHRVNLSPEKDIVVPVLSAAKPDTPHGPAVLIVSPRGKLLTLDSPFARRLLSKGMRVCAADLRGTGESAAGDFEIATDLWMLGRTLPGEWIADIGCVTRWLKTQPGVTGVCLVGECGMGETVLLAAACTPEIDRVIAEAPVDSYRSLISHEVRRPASVYVPGVLRHFDLPAVVSAIAPRQCVLSGNLDEERAFGDLAR